MKSESQNIITDIQRKDTIQRSITYILLVFILVLQLATTIYMLDRIDAFERSIDCKLLINPENRTKKLLQSCTKGNKQKVFEKTDNGTEPSFKTPSETSVNPTSVNKLVTSTSFNQPSQTPPNKVPITDSTPVIIPEIPVVKFQTRINPSTGQTEIKYDWSSFWVSQP